MTDETITLARLRELEQRVKAFAETSLPSTDEQRAAYDEEHVEIAAALRAAADTLAAREELLRRASRRLEIYAEGFDDRYSRALAAEIGAALTPETTP